MVVVGGGGGGLAVCDVSGTIFPLERSRDVLLWKFFKDG